MYKCEMCNYSSDRSTDLNRHNNSKKHIKNMYLINTNKIKKLPENGNFLGNFENNDNLLPKKGNFCVSKVSFEPLKLSPKITKNEKKTTNNKNNINDNDNTKNSAIVKTSEGSFLKTQNVDLTTHLCKCGKNFKHKSGLSRHKKTCNFQPTNTIETLSKQIEVLTQQLKNIVPNTNGSNANTYINNNTNNTNNNIINTSNTINTINTINNNQKNLNIITYVNQKYNDAQPIEMLQYNTIYKMLDVKDIGNYSLEDIIAFHSKKYNLDQFLGEIIVNAYKKTDPTKQQFWTSNIKKLTFLVRQILNKTDIVWLKDSNGVCITKHIIEPLLAEIKILMKDYQILCSNKLSTLNLLEKEYDTVYINGFNALKVVQSIDQKILHHKILTYIAPYFQLATDSQMIEI